MNERSTGRDADTSRERIAYHAYATAERLAMGLPGFLGRRLFAAAGAAAFHVAPKARAVVERNISRVLGVSPGSSIVRSATREAFLSYARYWYETFHVRVLPSGEVHRRFHVEGVEHIERAVQAGRGAVMALPHLGNWDLAGKWAHESGWRVTAVAELLRPQRLFELFLRHRRALGMEIVPLYDTAGVGEDLARRLSENHLIALVADRDLRGKGVVVEMFGAERRMPPGPALLSLATGVPLLPSAVYDLEDGWLVVIQPPLEIERTGDMRRDVTTLTRLLASEFERAIAAAPTQWHMFQPAWDDLPGEMRDVPGARAVSQEQGPAAPAAERSSRRLPR